MADPSSSVLTHRPTRLVPAATIASELVGRSSAAVRAQELVRRASALDSAALIVGERGTDVESVARELHERGRPARSPWVVVCCSEGDAAAIDAALFGRAAYGPRDFESVSPDSAIAAAGNGTLCLHDVIELPSAVQTRLARLMRDGEVGVHGSARAVAFRLTATSLPTIDAEVREHRFRADLFRRLTTSRIDLAPLRDRAEDVPALATRLLEDACTAEGRPARTFTQAALALLAALTWPGNLAELTTVVSRVAAESTEAAVPIERLLPALQLDRNTSTFVPTGSLREARQRFERDYIAAVLQHHGWRVAEAAETLGILRPNLYRKARQLGIPVTRLTD